MELGADEDDDNTMVVVVGGGVVTAVDGSITDVGAELP